jgi:hypothetical protein
VLGVTSTEREYMPGTRAIYLGLCVTPHVVGVSVVHMTSYPSVTNPSEEP